MINFKLLLNPMSKFQTKTITIIGGISLFIGSITGDIVNASYDGAFDIHLNPNINFLDSLLENSINVASIFILLYLIGKIIYPKTRMIDILNISLIYRIPLYISSPLILLPVFEKMSSMAIESNINKMGMDYSMMDIVQLIISSVLLIILLVYAIILLVNGFKTSTNSKKWQHYVAFIIALIVAEICSKYLINSINI